MLYKKILFDKMFKLNRSGKMNTSKIKLFIALIFILIFIDVFFMLSQNQIRWDKKFGSIQTESESGIFSVIKPSQKGSIDNFLAPIIDEISSNPRNGINEKQDTKYTILDSDEVMHVFKNSYSSAGVYFESVDFSGDPVIFLRKITTKSGRDVFARIEVKREKILKFPGLVFSRPFIFFVIIIIISFIAMYFIFSFYKLAVDSRSESQKHQLIQRMSRGLAHEIRNPLNAMYMSLEMIGRQLKPLPDEKVTEINGYMAILKNEILRLDNLVNRFMEFSKDVKLNYSVVSIQQLIKSVLCVMSPLAEQKKASIIFNSDSDVKIEIDCELIYQCIMNIIKNAVESVEEGGRIEISYAAGAIDCEIKIINDGEEITAENIPKVFDFYFSTKSEGSGIGLALTKKFIEAHFGVIRVSSEKSSTCFTVNIPLKAKRA